MAVWQAHSITPMVEHKLGGKSEVALLRANRSWKVTNVDYSQSLSPTHLFPLCVGTCCK